MNLLSQTKNTNTWTQKPLRPEYHLKLNLRFCDGANSFKEAVSAFAAVPDFVQSFKYVSIGYVLALAFNLNEVAGAMVIAEAIAIFGII